jgi:carbon storage regulator
MLVLERLPDESVVIGDHVEVRVLKTRRGKVWLGIDAPKDVPVHRREVYERIRKQGVNGNDAIDEPSRD